LLANLLSHGVACLETSESSSADFFLSVVKEDGLVNNSNDFSLPGKDNVISLFVSFFEFLGDGLGDGNRHEVLLSVNGKSLHLEALKEFHLIHESVKGVGPSFSNSLEEFSLHLIKSELGAVSELSNIDRLIDEGINNTGFASFL